MTRKIRLPQIRALEMIDDKASRAEWECGCVTVRILGIDGRAIGNGARGDPATGAAGRHETPDSRSDHHSGIEAVDALPVWVYLERCDRHTKERGSRFGGMILMNPSVMADPEIRRIWRR